MDTEDENAFCARSCDVCNSPFFRLQRVPPLRRDTSLASTVYRSGAIEGYDLEFVAFDAMHGIEGSAVGPRDGLHLLCRVTPDIHSLCGLEPPVDRGVVERLIDELCGFPKGRA